MFHLSFPAEGIVELYAGDRLVLRHSPETPALFLGFGREEIRMYRGNFTVRDREDARLPLRFLGAEGECLRFAHPDLCSDLVCHLKNQTAGSAPVPDLGIS
jgi:hypothetical protein